MKKAVLSLVCLLSLAACTTAVDDPFLQTTSGKGNSAVLAASVTPENAVAVVAAGLPTAVRQTVVDGSVEQTIVYDNATTLEGENTLAITIGRVRAKGMRNGPSQSDVMAEMRTALPGTPMRIVPQIGENAYGVFGYATGALAGKGSCLYAWQVAKDIGAGKAARIRLRYCSPSLPQERIVGLMESLHIKSALSSGPIPQPPAVENLAALPVVDPAAQTPDLVAVAEPKRSKTVRRAPKVVAETAAVADKAEPDVATANAVTVPLPGATNGKTENAVASPPAAPAPVKVAEVPEKPVATLVKPAAVPLPGTILPAQ